MNRNRIISLSGLLLCLLVGGYLRLAGADWGAGNPRDLGGSYAHPDERSVYNKTGGLRWDPVPREDGEDFFTYQRRAFENRFLDWNSGWNIESFNYGSFPYYALYALNDYANSYSAREALSHFLRLAIVFLAFLWFSFCSRRIGQPEGADNFLKIAFLVGASFVTYLLASWALSFFYSGWDNLILWMGVSLTILLILGVVLSAIRNWLLDRHTLKLSLIEYGLVLFGLCLLPWAIRQAFPISDFAFLPTEMEIARAFTLVWFLSFLFRGFLGGQRFTKPWGVAEFLAVVYVFLLLRWKLDRTSFLPIATIHWLDVGLFSILLAKYLPMKRPIQGILLLVIGSFVAPWLASLVFVGGSDFNWRYDNWGSLARPISGLCGTLTLFYIYRIGARIYGRRTGLLAAIFLTFTVLHLQLSHYFTFDVILAFFTTAAVYALLVFVDAETWPKRWRSILVASVWTGLAMATKFGGILLFVPWLVALMMVFWRHRPKVAIYRLRSIGMGAHLKLIGLVSFILIWATAFLAQPFGYLDNRGGETELSFVHIDFQQAPKLVPPALKTKLTALGNRLPPALKTKLTALGNRLDRVRRRIVVYTSEIGLHFGPLLSPQSNRPFQDFVAIGGGKYWRDVDEQRRMALVGGPAWTRQYENTTPFVYQWKNLLLYGMGAPLGLLCLFGLAWGFGKPLYRPDWKEIVVWAWMLPNFIPVHLFHTKFPRYLTPQIPFFCLWAAALAVAAYAYWKRREAAQGRESRLRMSTAVVVLTLAAVVWSGLYSFSFVEIFKGDHTWTTASQWFDKNVPDGKKLIHEGWDDPVPWDGRVARKYRMDRRNDTINNDSRPHIQNLCRNMVWADYYCFSSKRNYGAFLQAADNSDNRVRFYKALFAGRLGYQLVKTFSRPVNVLGIPIRYELADESLSLYDHPTVHIFERVKDLSVEEMTERVLHPPGWVLDITPKQILTAHENRFILAPRGDYALQLWLGALILLGWIFWPISYALFRASPDRGLFASKTLGLLLLTYLSWFGSSVGWWTNRPWATTLALVVWSFVSFACVKRLGTGMGRFLREHWKLALFSEAIFLLVFAYFMSIRMSNPDLNQGEKAMDSSFLSAVYRTDEFPANDPWYSERKINYYYYGHVIVGLFGKWVGAPPEYAYNLAVGTWPALVFVLILGIVFNLTGSYLGGLFGAFLGIMAGSGKAFFQLAANLNPTGGPLDPRTGFREKYVPHDGLPGYLGDAWGQIQSAFALTGEVFQNVWLAFRSAFDPDLLEAARKAHLPRLVSFDSYLWRLSRICKSVQANEFPAWTATFADLHAHLLVMPVGMLFVSLIVGYFQRKSRLWERTAEVGSSRAIAEVGGSPTSAFQLGAIGFTLGTVWVTNTWDLIGWSGLFLAGLFILILYQRKNWVRTKRWTLGRSLRRMGIWGDRIRAIAWWKMGFIQEIVLPFATVLAVGYSLYYPFHRSFATPERVKGIGWLHREACGWTTPYEFLQIFGTFLIPLLIGLSFLYWRWIVGRRGAWWKASLFGLVACGLAYLTTTKLRGMSREVFDPAQFDTPTFSPSTLGGWAFWQYLDADIAFLVGGFVFLLFLLFIPFVLQRRGTLSHRLAFLVLLLGLAIVAGCEVVFINEGWSKPLHRLNTVFKLHLQAWLCLSIGCGALLGIWWSRPAESASIGPRVFGRACRYLLGYPLLFVAIAFASIYPLIAPYLFSQADGFRGRTRQIEGEFTADGLNYLRLRSPDEAAAIDWLRSRVQGTPVTLEAAGEHYDYSRSRISTHTGLPTLLGMPHHSRERGNLPEPRIQDCRVLYTSTSRDRVRDLLQERQIRYVVVGPAERKLYSVKAGAGLRKFAEWTDLFSVAFHSEVKSPGVTLYAVRPDYKLAEDWIAPPAPQEPERLVKEEGLALLNGREGYLPGEYREPRGLATGPDGKIYVADTFNHRIQCFAPGGPFLWWTGEQGADPGDFDEPCDVAVDPEGRLYVLDTWNARIQVFSPTGEIENTVTGFGGGSRGLAVGRIRLARMTGSAWTLPATPELSGPAIVIADTSGRRLSVFNQEGKPLGAWGAAGAGPHTLSEPVDVEITPFGLAVADARDAKIKFYDGRGRYLQSWDIPTQAPPGTTNEINLLWDMERGRLFVTDPEHDKVYAFDGQGTIRFETSVSGKPTGISKGKNGRIYIAARSRHRIVFMPVME